MSYEIPAISAAMDEKILQLDHITHNLANAGTPGFKTQHLYFLQTLEEEMRANQSEASQSAIVVDFTRGMFQKTDNPLDLHLQEDGFFVVNTKTGQAFTRKGDFTINKLNQLVTQAGDPVMGEGGPIVLKTGKIHIGKDGAVFVDESQMGQLKIVDFTNRQALKNTGDGLYRDDGQAGIRKVDKPNIAAGSIELSNVNVVKEMTEMIDIHRTFEIYQKIIQTLSEQDKLSTSRIGRIS